MEGPKTLTLANCIVVFLIFSGHTMAGEDDPTKGYHPEERDALYDLKHTFNNSILNTNWNGLQCYMNKANKTWIGISCTDGRVTGISLEGLGLTGQVQVNALVNLSQLTNLSFKNNFISGPLMDFSANVKLTHIDLSENMFDGTISPSLVGLESLESLQLQENFLTGSIPSFNQSSLRAFNVSNNKLSGEIPNTRVLQSFSIRSYYNNAGLCGPPTPELCPTRAIIPSRSDKKKSHFFRGSFLIIFFVVLVVIGLALVATLFFIYYKKTKSNKENKAQPSKGEEMMGYEVEKKENKKMEIERESVVEREEEGNLSFIVEMGDFELGDLLNGTADGLGTGGIGSTYKVVLEGRPAVVVKRLKEMNSFSSEEFTARTKAIADLKHPNLLPLLAYCHSKDEKLLVYKFMQNGSLFHRLHGNRQMDRIPFKWNSRLSAAKDVAQAMACLHLNMNAQNPIPHGNLKSSNLLLDENEAVLVSEYGFTSLINPHIAAQHMASYKSPEYQNRRKISAKSDVWSYGHLLLELLTGKASIHSAPHGVDGMDLSSWVQRAVRERCTTDIFDEEISVEKGATEGAVKLLQIALQCCNESPEKRPEMEEVQSEVEDIRFINIDDDEDLLNSSDQSLTEDSSIAEGALKLLQIALKRYDELPETHPEMEVAKDMNNMKVGKGDEDESDSLYQSFADDSFSTDGSMVV